MTNKRFRVAFSFAGEKRDFVAKVAAILADRFGEEAILYDNFHEAKFARSDLGIHLPDLYHRESDLVVLVISKGYENKEWCGLEWTAIHSLIKERRVEDVMLCRYDHALIKGLYSTAGFVELDTKSPDQAAKLILQRLKANGIDTRKTKHAPNPVVTSPMTTSTPNNLPRLQYFFGREAELKRIADALAPDARGWGALIDGPGGIGKTALAIRSAELAPSGRFRRIIFLSSKERELAADGQRSLGTFVLPSYLEILNAIASELDRSDFAKSTEAERPDVILRALRGSDVLLLLDNLETLPGPDRDQIFAFLNRLPQGCSAIVTSRRRADASAAIVRLDRLDWKAAQQLIVELSRENARLLKASESEQRALYEETGGNPLLMRWIAGQLGLGRCRNISAALDFLRKSPPGNDPLEFIFGDLLDTFTPNETQVLAALTYFTIPIEAKIVAELVGISQTAAQTALGDLANRALVMPDVEERSFTLVPMVADFLRRKRPEAVAETGNRLEQRSYAVIVENGYYNHERFSVLDDAWPTVAPALPLFIEGPNPRLQTICNALTDFLNYTGRWDERLSLNQQAEAKAMSSGDHHHAGWRAYQVCVTYFLREDADAVLASAERTAAHWQKEPAGPREQATAIRLRGSGHELKADYPAAIKAYQEALSLYRTLSAENEDVVSVLTSLAAAKQHSGDLNGAEENYREALRVARAVNFAEGVALCTGNLAALALVRKDWIQAESLAQEALTLSERVGRQQIIGSNCRRLALALVRQGKPPGQAMHYAHRALEIYTRLGITSEIESTRRILDECEAANS